MQECSVWQLKNRENGNMLELMSDQVRKHAPLIHNMTNRVSINDCANILLACGASPIMAEAIEEVEEITAMCDGLVLNMGMPGRQKIEAMKKAGKRANALHIPVVLDPVGVGASAFRREAVSELLKEVRFTVIRGNFSEIRTLMCGVCGTRGVDAEPTDLMGEKNLYQNVKTVTAFAEKSGAIVVATGKNDIVSDERTAYWIPNGHSMMQTVTGVGCQLSALAAAYVAANPKHTLEAVTAAVSAIGVCGELAYERMSDLDGNASYRNYLIDAVYRLDGKKLECLARVEKVNENGEKSNEM